MASEKNKTDTAKIQLDNDTEPGHMVILDNATYDYLESEFEAGLASVRSESDWISMDEIREFVEGLKTKRTHRP